MRDNVVTMSVRVPRLLLVWTWLMAAGVRLTVADDDASVPGDVLRFRNGDRIHGELLSAGPAAGLHWKNSEAKTVMDFSLENITEVKLAARAEDGRSGEAHAVVGLTNGDQLAGDIDALTEQSLVFRTMYAGTLSIKRSMIQSLTPNLGKRETIYIGPTGLDGWTRTDNQQAWSFKNGAFYGYLHGGIGRDVKLPDVANIECDVAWRGGRFYLMLAFYADNLQQLYNGNCYALQFTGNSVNLQHGRRGVGFDNFDESVSLPSFQTKTHAHIAVRVNKPAKIIALFIDGVLAKQWIEPREFAGKGTGLLFYAQQQSPIKISHIAVTAWDGRFETEATISAKEQDQVRLLNGDKLSGDLKSVTKNEVTFITSYATLKIPLERVERIELASSKAERARRRANDLQAHFSDDNRVTVALEKLDAKILSGASENFGKADFELGTFRRLRFDVYRENSETPTDEPDADWIVPQAPTNRIITD